MDIERIGPALGKLPSGVYVATGMLKGVEVGMLASFIEQASFNPPMVTAALGSDRRLAEAIAENKMLGINILAEGENRLMKPFANPENEAPFDGVALEDNEHGLPQLADALGFLACKVVDQMPCGDHTVYAAEVIDGDLTDETAAPMVRIRKNGFQY